MAANFDGAIRTIYLDLDGVLVDFVRGAMEAHGATLDRIRPGEWHLERSLGITQGQFWQKCQGHLFWESLPWTADGRSILDEVESLRMRFHADLFLLSSPSDDAGSFSGKYAWLEKHLPDYKRSLVLACNKRAAGPRDGALLIDDSDANVRAWRGDWSRLGGPAILVPRWTNSGHQIAGPSNEGSLPWLRRKFAEFVPADPTGATR